MQKKGILGLIIMFVLFLLMFNILNDLRSKIVYLQLMTDISLKAETSNNEKTVKCENFKVSVNMLQHPCGQTVKEQSGSSVTHNLTNSEKSIDRIKSFEKIYETAIWKSNGESKSGMGSTKDNTRQIKSVHKSWPS